MAVTTLVFNIGGVKPRREMLDGEEYLVVPQVQTKQQ